MSFIKERIIPICGSVIGLKKLIDSTKEIMVNIFGHTISDEYLPHISPLYKPKNTKEFEQDLDFLLKRFQPISVTDVLNHVNQNKILKKPSFHLSFDDGLREIHDVVMPILIRKGVPATVFINSNFVNNQDLFFRYKAALVADKNPEIKKEVLNINYPERRLLDEIAKKNNIDFTDFLSKQQPYLTVEQLKILQENGFTIGAHSQDHPNYNLIPKHEQIKQTISSCDYVQKFFSEQKRYFAFPFSADGVGISFFESILTNIDLTFGVSGLNSAHNGKHINRIDMENYGKNAKDYIYRAYLTNLINHYGKMIKRSNYR